MSCMCKVATQRQRSQTFGLVDLLDSVVACCIATKPVDSFRRESHDLALPRHAGKRCGVNASACKEERRRGGD
jgi:hypothetical protein